MSANTPSMSHRMASRVGVVDSSDDEDEEDDDDMRSPGRPQFDLDSDETDTDGDEYGLIAWAVVVILNPRGRGVVNENAVVDRGAVVTTKPAAAQPTRATVTGRLLVPEVIMIPACSSRIWRIAPQQQQWGVAAQRVGWVSVGRH